MMEGPTIMENFSSPTFRVLEIDIRSVMVVYVYARIVLKVDLSTPKGAAGDTDAML